MLVIAWLRDDCSVVQEDGKDELQRDLQKQETATAVAEARCQEMQLILDGEFSRREGDLERDVAAKVRIELQID